jgi:hypothetical protein
VRATDASAPSVEVTWRCQQCLVAGVRKPPTLFIGTIQGEGLRSVSRRPSVRLGKRETERDLAKFGWTSGSYNRTGSEPLPLDREPYTNTCAHGHEVSKTGEELLDALSRQGRANTAYV